MRHNLLASPSLLPSPAQYDEAPPWADPGKNIGLSPWVPAVGCGIFPGRTSHQHLSFSPKCMVKNFDSWQKQLRDLGLSSSTESPLIRWKLYPQVQQPKTLGPQQPFPSSFIVQRIHARREKPRRSEAWPPPSTLFIKQGCHSKRSRHCHSKKTSKAVAEKL